MDTHVHGSNYYYYYHLPTTTYLPLLLLLLQVHVHGSKVATTLAAHMRPLLIDVIEPDAAVTLTLALTLSPR